MVSRAPKITPTPPHPRVLGWFGTTALAMGGSNQMIFLITALFVGQGVILGQGSAAVPLLIAGVLLGYAAAPAWTELVLMWPNRVGGIAVADPQRGPRAAGYDHLFGNRGQQGGKTTGVETNEQSAAIVRAVLGLGNALKVPVIAEGVETEGERVFLMREGCQEMQGYLVGRPCPIATYAALTMGVAASAPSKAMAG
jgi:hypothetical protein